LQFLPDISKLQSLRSLIIRSSNDLGSNNAIYSFDLSNNPRLEYLQIADCRLTRFPKLTNIPPSLKYVNFSGNLIESIDEDSLRTLKNVKIFVADNLIPEKDYAPYKNIGFSLEKMWKILPDEFMETY
jgi:Leucine-rich repeat (LRR) protein